MPFNSYPYFVFLAVAVLGFPLAGKSALTGRRVFLLLASYAFYAWWRADFLALLCGSTLVNYALGREIEQRRARQIGSPALLIAGLVFNLGLIATFKYDTLFVGTADHLLGLGLPIPHFFLPLAISFFTFEQISYLVDADAGKTHGYTLLDYALFVAYFPHLIAGPIVRHNDLIPQFRQTRGSNDDLATGITLFTVGLAKKTLIADNLAPFADAIFNAAGRGLHLGPTDAWLGTLFFAFQIYFDFSAYSDMALGSSVILGIRLPVNFHSPYKAASIIEFWRRWHISLSAFLRDYLYVPLGGNRQWPGAAHSQSLHHHALGRAVARRQLDLHAVGRAARLLSQHQSSLPPRHQRHDAFAPPCACRCMSPRWRLTFAATTLAWIVFRAPDLASARNVAAGLVGGGHQQYGELFAAGGDHTFASRHHRLVHAQQHGDDVEASAGAALALCGPTG